MNVLKSLVSLLLVFVMVSSMAVLASDTVVNNTYYKNEVYGETHKVVTANGQVCTDYAAHTPTQNLVIKYDFSISSSVANNAEIFISSVRTSNGKELKVFRLYGTSLRYYYSTNTEKNSGITVTPDVWHSVAIEYSQVLNSSNKYTKTYDLYFDGVLIADDVVDGYTDQSTNSIARITLYASSASATAPILFDNVQYFDGKLDTTAMIGLKSDAKLRDGKIVVHGDAATAKAEVTAALSGGVLDNIYTDSTLTTPAAKVADGCFAKVTTPDGKYYHKYELTTKIFEETFDGNSGLTEQILTSSVNTEIKSGDTVIYKRKPVNYTLSSSSAKSLSQTADDKYCQIANDTCVLNTGYPRITLKNVFPLSTDFTSEMSLYVTGNATHGMDVRLSSGNISLGGDNADLAKYNYNSWNKVAVQVKFEEEKVTASLFINGKFVRSASKAGENLSCTEIRYFSHPLNTYSQKNITDIYNEGGLEAVNALVPVQFEDAIDNIRITYGAYDASKDISVVNTEFRIKDNKVYADLTNLEGFAQSFAGDKLIKIVNNDETNEVKEGTLIFVKTNSNDFWNVYTVTDATFKVLSFDKNANGTNATATFNNHTTEPAILIAAIYEDEVYVTMYTEELDDNADILTLAENIELSAGQNVKFMLFNSIEDIIPYCKAIE